MAIVLPKGKIEPLTQDPKNLILYGTPKVGKTTLCAQLPDSLLIDFESGSDYVSAQKIKASSLQELKEICDAIEAAGRPYKFIVLDTVSAIEEFALPLALALYKQTPAGSNFQFNDVKKAPNGMGYLYIREAVEKIIAMVQKVTTNVILLGHVKDSALVDSEGNDTGNIKSLDLSGKLGRILAAKSDAIGWIHRDKTNNLCVNFKAVEAQVGARPKHLANQDIIVAERDEETGDFVSRWERIFPSLG